MKTFSDADRRVSGFALVRVYPRRVMQDGTGEFNLFRKLRAAFGANRSFQPYDHETTMSIGWSHGPHSQSIFSRLERHGPKLIQAFARASCFHLEGQPY